MNAGRYKIHLPLLLFLFMFQAVSAGPARVSTDQGNRLYEQEKFNEAIKQYDHALIDSPHVLEPKFNKANSYYRLDDLDKAMDLYRQVAAESKDMKLVTSAKYNLGNCRFQQGSKQKDSDLQKAIDDMESAIGHWRSALDIEPQNQKAAKNIEVARLTIKDILDQLKDKQQQQQDPNQPQNPNPSQDSNQQQQQEPEQQQQQQQAQEKGEEQKQKSDTTVQEILDKEQRDKKLRQFLQRARYQKVEKDW